jgi:hypothetical protein
MLTHYCSGHQIEINDMGGTCSTCGGSTSVYRDLVGKRKGKRPLGRTRRRWEYNINMDLQKWDVGAWI